jgi:uncharacterized protein YndB with AHSA1/START domain
MPIKKHPDGRRSVEAETEVVGTPEQVWRAIATGPGISSWFVPSQIEERPGGAVFSTFGPGMDSHGKITAWQPHHRYVVTTEEGPGEVASEWTVEAQAGGVCKVRVVHSWFASTDDWDGQFEGHSFGWISFFQILQRYMQYFAGQSSSIIALSPMTTEPDPWGRLVRPLGLDKAAPRQSFSTPPGVPELSGVVEVVNPPEWPGLLLRLEKPAPALAHLFVMPMGPQTLLSIRFYLYGPEGAAAAKDVEAKWNAWLGTIFST